MGLHPGLLSGTPPHAIRITGILFAHCMRVKMERTSPGSASSVCVVEHHRRKHGVIGKQSHYPWLKIATECLDIVDEIIMSFIWIERRRSFTYVEPKRWGDDVHMEDGSGSSSIDHVGGVSA